MHDINQHYEFTENEINVLNFKTFLNSYRIPLHLDQGRTSCLNLVKNVGEILGFKLLLQTSKMVRKEKMPPLLVEVLTTDKVSKAE